MAITDQEFYDELVKRKENTRVRCDNCGEVYRFTNINMCKRCASVLCHHCVRESNDQSVKRKCQCGGEMD